MGAGEELKSRLMGHLPAGMQRRAAKSELPR